jgi:hypothetical protein
MVDEALLEEAVLPEDRDSSGLARVSALRRRSVARGD